MNNFEYLKSLTLDDLVEWLDKYGQFDGAPWSDWFDTEYCSQCESIEVEVPAFNNTKAKCAYCELENKCKYFPCLDKVPDLKEILKMWLYLERK